MSSTETVECLYAWFTQSQNLSLLSIPSKTLMVANTVWCIKTQQEDARLGQDNKQFYSYSNYQRICNLCEMFAAIKNF